MVHEDIYTTTEYSSEVKKIDENIKDIKDEDKNTAELSTIIEKRPVFYPQDRQKIAPEDNPRFLGIHIHYAENNENNQNNENHQNNEELRTSHFVGILRIDNKVLIINPKVKRFNPVKMLSEVLRHPIVGRQLKYGKVYAYNFNEKPIRLSMQDSDFLIFLAINYIGILYNIAKKGLVKGYTKKKENLNGRIKGKVLYRENLKNNIAKGKLHYTYCSYNYHSEDILENRILKVAFMKAVKSLQHNKIISDSSNSVGDLIKYISSAFTRVSSTRISPSDFRLTVTQRIRADYKDAIRIAKIILKNLGYDPDMNFKSEDIKQLTVYPYWIDMNELFERYCEVKLREGYIGQFKDCDIYPGYDNNNIKTCVGDLRPDFIAVNKKLASGL